MTKKNPHVCPWWLGYFLVSPIRRWFDDPDRLLRPLIRPGMRVLDFGAGMGFHSLPAARLAGESGHVTCVDLQPKMLASLRRRAERAGLLRRIDTVLTPPDGLRPTDVDRAYDLALAIYVLHETPDPGAVLRSLAGVLAPGGRLLIVEPKSHVPEARFKEELAEAARAGLVEEGPVPVRRGFGELLRKPGAQGQTTSG